MISSFPTIRVNGLLAVDVVDVDDDSDSHLVVFSCVAASIKSFGERSRLPERLLIMQTLILVLRLFGYVVQLLRLLRLRPRVLR